MKRIQQHNLPNKKFYDIYVSGDQTDRTLYLIGPYKGAPVYLTLFIRRMKRHGYGVVYLQPHPEVLSSSNPEYLGMAIREAVNFIRNDIKESPSQHYYLTGVSLGSYLGLNIQLEVPFEKFVVVAGGAPLMGLFHSDSMFRKARKKGGVVDHHWQKFDEAYQDVDLSYSSTMFINSFNDRIIKNDEFQKFLDSYKKTGARVVNAQNGNLNHTLQALSINFKSKPIRQFLEK